MPVSFHSVPHLGALSFAFALTKSVPLPLPFAALMRRDCVRAVSVKERVDRFDARLHAGCSALHRDSPDRAPWFDRDRDLDAAAAVSLQGEDRGPGPSDQQAHRAVGHQHSLLDVGVRWLRIGDVGDGRAAWHR